MFVPFNATVELAVNAVPFSVTVAAVLIGPAFGEIDINVGGGGLAIDTVSSFDMGELAVKHFTVIVAVPADASRFAGTEAVMNSRPEPTLPHCWAASAVPFHRSAKEERTTGKPVVGKRLEPYTVITVGPDPTRNCDGEA